MEEFDPKNIGKAIKQMVLCKKCLHRDVCGLKDSEEQSCDDFLSDGNYKNYGSIYSLFDPIFSWLKFHYPAGDVKFLVDSTSAIMYLEHGVAAYSEEIRNAVKFSSAVQQQAEN